MRAVRGISYTDRMPDTLELVELVEQAARRRLKVNGPERVLVQPAVDSEGEEALRVTLVIRPESVSLITGDEALDLISDVRRGFDQVGEGRFPLIEYATNEEIAAAERETAQEKAQADSEEDEQDDDDS